jgi:hypothetical protein
MGLQSRARSADIQTGRASHTGLVCEQIRATQETETTAVRPPYGTLHI